MYENMRYFCLKLTEEKVKKITITGVPEHFNFPWLETIKSQPFQKEGIVLEWINEPRGSGAMNKALREGSTDIAIVLTESFVKDRIEGNGAKIIGIHVATPLIWGIHTSALSPVNSLNELSDSPFLISRLGSGSHLMAYVLADREVWQMDESKFEIIENLEGAKKAFQSPEKKAFLWEKYTTKPLVDKGLFIRVGEVPTPWPCFVIAATERIRKEAPEIIQKLTRLVYQKSKSLMLNHEETQSVLSKTYGIKEEDINEWLTQTKWQVDCSVIKNDLTKTMEILKGLRLIKKTVAEEYLVDETFVDLI